jgi:PST family polysaccharide transporter
MGCVGRVISWPMGFVLLAKGASHLFAGIQTLFNFVHIVLIWTFLSLFGIDGVAVAFFTLNLFTILVLLLLSKRLIDFSWSASVWRMIVLMAGATLALFVASRSLSELFAAILGVVITGSVGLFCLRALIARLGSQHKISRMALSIPIACRLFSFEETSSGN